MPLLLPGVLGSTWGTPSVTLTPGRQAGGRAAQVDELMGPSTARVWAPFCSRGDPSVLGICRSREVTGSNVALSSIGRDNDSSLSGDRL